MTAMSARARAAEPERLVRATLRGLRPKQWAKNVLVFVAPLTSARIGEYDVLWRTLAAFAIFCAVSSGVYLVNDARDVEADRRHPTKRLRPIASGALPVAMALTLAALLLAAGLGAAFLVAPALGATVSAYVLLQMAYTAGLKHQAVLDLAVVAAGFLLRAVAGGAASGIELSQWFLLVASFGSLFMVAGKRYSEIHALGAEAGTRRSLAAYSESYLRFVWSAAAGASITFYALWAFENRVDGLPWAALSVAPFTLGLLRYAVDVDRGLAGSPEEIVWRDRVLAGLGVVWLTLLALTAFRVGG